MFVRKHNENLYPFIISNYGLSTTFDPLILFRNISCNELGFRFIYQSSTRHKFINLLCKIINKTSRR